MAGYSYSNSTSTSTPSAIQTPQSDWALTLSQLLSSLAQNQYNWALGQFNAGQQITDQNINQYMKTAGYGEGLATNLLGRYENVFEPMMNAYIQAAGSYNSQARQQFEMGRAESTAGQADTAAMNAAQKELQSFGVNPNSGRYQDLVQTSRLQDAATRAGAGTEASVNTAAIGRQMEQTAAQMGQNVPGMTVNALQSAYSGITGAENAELGQLNTGANLVNSATNVANAAANANKLPPVGDTRFSHTTTQSNPGQNGGGSGGGGSGNSNGRGGNGSGSYGNPLARPNNGPAQVFPPKQPIQPDGSGTPGPWGITTVGGGGTYGGPFQPTDINGAGGNPDVIGPWGGPNPLDGTTPSGSPDPQPPMGPWGDPGQLDPFGGMNGGGGGGGNTPSQGPEYGYTPFGTDTSGQGGNTPSQGSEYGYDQASGGQASGGGYGGYAGGGETGVIPNATSGGYVPTSASPSHGQKTDDISARLNAKEFVMPRDVVEHKGTQFFHNIIQKSRQQRLGVSGPPAQPKMKPALNHAPTFQSHYLGGGHGG